MISYRNGNPAIVFSNEASSQDIIKSVLHIFKAQQEFTSIERENNSASFIEMLIGTKFWVNEHLPEFIVGLDNKDWQSDVIFWEDRGNRFLKKI